MSDGLTGETDAVNYSSSVQDAARRLIIRATQHVTTHFLFPKIFLYQLQPPAGWKIQCLPKNWKEFTKRRDWNLETDPVHQTPPVVEGINRYIFKRVYCQV
jgi:hypothetical protein